MDIFRAYSQHAVLTIGQVPLDRHVEKGVSLLGRLVLEDYRDGRLLGRGEELLSV